MVRHLKKYLLSQTNLNEYDLNKLDIETLELYKEIMNENYKMNAIEIGEQEYEYDKRVEA